MAGSVQALTSHLPGKTSTIQPRYCIPGWSRTSRDPLRRLDPPDPDFDPGKTPMTDDLASLFAYDRWAETRMLDACRLLAPERYGEAAGTRLGLCPVVGGPHRRGDGPLDSPIHGPGRRGIPRGVGTGHAGCGHPALGREPRRPRPTRPRADPRRTSRPLHLPKHPGRDLYVPLWAALRHVINHATYHRGQVASKLKLLGIEPPVTDFVYWAIEQASQPPR